jgi:hypothetical protein
MHGRYTESTWMIGGRANVKSVPMSSNVVDCRPGATPPRADARGRPIRPNPLHCFTGVVRVCWCASQGALFVVRDVEHGGRKHASANRAVIRLVHHNKIRKQLQLSLRISASPLST